MKALPPVPHFENPQGYKCPVHHYEGYLWKRAIWEYTADPVAPLTFCSWAGIRYRPDQHYFTDKASIPLPLQILPGLGKDRHELPALLHDSGYTFGGLFVKYRDETDYSFKPMTRLQVDDLFRTMCRFDIQPSPLMSHAYWIGVRLGGWASWKKGDRRK